MSAVLKGGDRQSTNHIGAVLQTATKSRIKRLEKWLWTRAKLQGKLATAFFLVKYFGSSFCVIF
jgi:hypothetical protein